MIRKTQTGRILAEHWPDIGSSESEDTMFLVVVMVTNIPLSKKLHTSLRNKKFVSSDQIVGSPSRESDV